MTNLTARTFLGMLLALPVIAEASAELTELIPAATVKLIAEESSGIIAKRNLDSISLYHRTRASSQFRAAAEHIRDRLHDYGYAEATIIEYPADGKTMFGTQKSRLAWDVDFAELWELDTIGNRAIRHASWTAMPLSVAQDSVSGRVTTTLIDIGAGTDEADYAGKDIEGQLVLTSSQPESVAAEAVGERGAAGIISYAPNQKTAWWLENDRLVRWGHLGNFSKTKTFAFMISLKAARRLQARLANGEVITMDAHIEARQEPGVHSVVSAVLPGSDPKLAHEEIIFSCHLDHPRPGANDNASGCVSILEAARTLKALVDRGLLPAPRRSLRFIWPPEIEGSLMYLSQLDDTSHILSNIHLDMVGGDTSTKSIFRISGSPLSLPSFVSDIGHEIGHFVNHQSEQHASGLDVSFPLVSPEGSRNPQMALMKGIDLGSDHEIFNEGSWGIPGIYLHDWPDRYIHTNFDTADRIDPTKLKRAAFIAAMQGWILANFGPSSVEPTLDLLRSNALKRAGTLNGRRGEFTPEQWSRVVGVHWAVERDTVASINRFAAMSDTQSAQSMAFLDKLSGMFDVPLALSSEEAGPVYQRNPSIKGPMSGFDYDYMDDHLPEQFRSLLRLGSTEAYETLNLVDGHRSVSQIHAWLMAEFGPVDWQDVADYLRALSIIEVIGTVNL